MEPPEREANHSDASVESRILELVAMDWARLPFTTICERFPDIHWRTIYQYRQTDLYKVTFEQFKSAWLEEMAKLPTTASLRKEIQQAFAMGIRKLINELPDYKPKEFIAALRLTAQIDGRFLGSDGDEGGDGRHNEGVDSIAHELIQALERIKTDKGSVQ